MKNNTWNIIEKLFDSFPFQFLISCVIGGLVYFITPNDTPLLTKFGVFWYIVFVSLISFLIIALIVWLYNFIRSKKQISEMNDITVEKLRIQLYSITDKWSEDDIKTLRELVESNNEPIQRTGHYMGSNSLFTSNMLENKQGGDVETEFYKNDEKIIVKSSSTIYWLKEDVFNICKIILDKYGKLSKFDKGDKNNG